MPKRKTLVMKFGGTSVGSVEAVKAAARIVQDARREWASIAVIVSAMAGVTNLLLDNAKLAAAGDVHQLPQAEKSLRNGHQSIVKGLITKDAREKQVNSEIDTLIDSFTDLCRAINVLGEATPRALDAVASLGERMNVRLFSAVLDEFGVNAAFVESTDLVVTNDHFQNAHPNLPATQERTRAALLPLFDKGIVPVITGFIGATANGAVTTLGRGGSDYSAGIIGAVLPADDVWIWTDVDGVMTADPRFVPDARTLPEISYAEIAELAYFGAKVLHPKTVRPVVDAGTSLRICNTFNPSHPGTRLTANTDDGSNGNGQVIKAVTAIRNQRLVTIEGRGMLGVPGVAAHAFAAVASTETSVPLIIQASSEQSICFAVPAESAEPVKSALEDAFTSELAESDIDRIRLTGDISIITVVGARMRSTPGVAGKVFTKLGDNNVNVLAIAQGSSEVSISLVVESKDTEKAVRSLHELTHS